jgi:hypothetical protein
MHRKKFIVCGIIGALLLGLAGGALAYYNVSAQATTPAPNTPGGQGQPGKGPRAGFPGGYSQQDLATALGIDVTTLQAAYKTANTEALKEAVSKGLITQDQAYKMTAKGIDQRPLGGFGRPETNGIDYNAILANALGISTDQLQVAYTKAFNTNVDNAVKSGTLTQAQADLEKGRNALSSNAKFQASLQSAYEVAIKQAVTDGVITQDQADQILKDQSSKGFPGGFGGSGGFGRRGFGDYPGSKQTPQNPAQPTATPGSSS